MVELTFKGEKFDVTIKGESIAQIKEEYLKIKDDLEKEFGEINITFRPEIKKELEPKTKNNKETVADKIMSLKEEGFFDKPKAMVEIKAKMEELGFFYPITYFPPYLLKLCNERNIRRFKEKQNKKNIWMYVKY